MRNNSLTRSQLVAKKFLFATFIVLSFLFSTSTKSAAADNLEATVSPVIYQWYQGWQPVRMTSTNNSACFLTGMGGKFMGGGEVIRVVARDGYWYLEGESGQSGVSALAQCIIGTSEAPIRFTRSYSWHQDNRYWTRMIPLNEGACFLTEVSGKFQGSGEAVFVYSDSSTSFWWLGGQSQQRWVNAKARCIIGLSASHQYLKHQDDRPRGLIRIGNPQEACFLTFVTGKFQGNAETITISDGGVYGKYLSVSSRQKSVQGGARCVHN